MIAVVQRVREASVEVAGAADGSRPPYLASIEDGLLVLLGVAGGDTDVQADWIAGKLARLRVFRDADGRMNRSVMDVAGSILLVSQFTLLGDTARGNRPSFIHAAGPTEADRLYQRVAARLRSEHQLPVETGVFGAMMDVRLWNDGPVTLIIQS